MDATSELPLGFGMALAQNEKAMHTFATLPRGAQLDLITRASHVHSRQEMQTLVESIAR